MTATRAMSLDFKAFNAIANYAQIKPVYATF